MQSRASCTNSVYKTKTIWWYIAFKAEMEPTIKQSVKLRRSTCSIMTKKIVLNRLPENHLWLLLTFSYLQEMRSPSLKWKSIMVTNLQKYVRNMNCWCELMKVKWIENFTIIICTHGVFFWSVHAIWIQCTWESDFFMVSTNWRVFWFCDLAQELMKQTTSLDANEAYIFWENDEVLFKFHSRENQKYFTSILNHWHGISLTDSSWKKLVLYRYWCDWCVWNRLMHSNLGWNLAPSGTSCVGNKLRFQQLPFTQILYHIRTSPTTNWNFSYSNISAVFLQPKISLNRLPPTPFDKITCNCKNKSKSAKHRRSN